MTRSNGKYPSVARTERRARKAGFSVIADLAGHGVGRGIHEPPTAWNVEVPRDRTVLHEGAGVRRRPRWAPLSVLAATGQNLAAAGQSAMATDTRVLGTATRG